MKHYLLNILLGLDIFVCSFLPKSKHRQTISGYLGSNFDGSIVEMGINYIFYKFHWWNSPDHCSDTSSFENGFINY